MTKPDFKVELLKEHLSTRARVKRITTPHGSFLTPTFMPVGTKAAVNTLTPAVLQEIKTQIILGGNTYHMLCAPGLEVIKRAGGMHPFMGWSGPMLTDSGGYQVFSLSKNSKICKIDERGAKFKHPQTGEILILTPERSIEAQKIIGADIIMAFDQCTEDVDDRRFVREAMERTHRWLAQSKQTHMQNPCSAYGHKQALFGIIQGGQFDDLRRESRDFILSQELDGIAIGGEAAGAVMDKTERVLEWIVPELPKEKPIYVMGVGLHPSDLLRVTAFGIDILTVWPQLVRRATVLFIQVKLSRREIGSVMRVLILKVESISKKSAMRQIKDPSKRDVSVIPVVISPEVIYTIFLKQKSRLIIHLLVLIMFT